MIIDYDTLHVDHNKRKDALWTLNHDINQLTPWAAGLQTLAVKLRDIETQYLALDTEAIKAIKPEQLNALQELTTSLPALIIVEALIRELSA